MEHRCYGQLIEGKCIDCLAEERDRLHDALRELWRACRENDAYHVNRIRLDNALREAQRLAPLHG